MRLHCRRIVLPRKLAARNRIEQCLRIRMLRIAEHLRRPSVLHHLAIFHHGNEVADLSGDAQIMGDEDDGKPEPLPQFAEQLQHLCLH